jgi:tetratricopeptide (TPR) repeat protein
VAWTDLFVVHAGSDQSPEGRAKKHERDLRLLHLEEQERPTHPFTLFNLGMTYADKDEYQVAARYLQRSLAHTGPDESHLPKAYALLVRSLCKLNEPETALNVCADGLRRFPNDIELLYRCGILQHQFGRLDAAKQAF